MNKPDWLNVIIALLGLGVITASIVFIMVFSVRAGFSLACWLYRAIFPI